MRGLFLQHHSLRVILHVPVLIVRARSREGGEGGAYATARTWHARPGACRLFLLSTTPIYWRPGGTPRCLVTHRLTRQALSTTWPPWRVRGKEQPSAGLRRVAAVARKHIAPPILDRPSHMFSPSVLTITMTQSRLRHSTGRLSIGHGPGAPNCPWPAWTASPGPSTLAGLALACICRSENCFSDS